MAEGTQNSGPSVWCFFRVTLARGRVGMERALVENEEREIKSVDRTSWLAELCRSSF